MLDDRQRLRDKALLQKELGAFFKEVGETALAHEHLAAAKELFDRWGIDRVRVAARGGADGLRPRTKTRRKERKAIATRHELLHELGAK